MTGGAPTTLFPDGMFQQKQVLRGKSLRSVRFREKRKTHLVALALPVILIFFLNFFTLGHPGNPTF
jgi:hypothetical protein